MTSLYELIGRLIVRLAWSQYGRQLKIAGAIGVALIGIGGYLAATREPPEG